MTDTHDIRPGDRFEILGTVVGTPAHDGYLLVEFVDGPQLYLPPSTLRASRRLPREIKVGDRVKWSPVKYGITFGIVLAIHEGAAWVDAGTTPITVSTVSLTLADPAPEMESRNA